MGPASRVLTCLLVAGALLPPACLPGRPAAGTGGPGESRGLHRTTVDCGGITRLDSTRQVIYLLFTGHEFAEGGGTIATTLRERNARASFFFTGDFYRNPSFDRLIRRLKRDGHYLGAHSDKHLLYASWARRDSTLLSAGAFREDLLGNYRAMERFGLRANDAPYYLPAFEWYNDTISAWTARAGFLLINFTPGTSSNADYTIPSMGKSYVPSDTILARILRFETSHPGGLNGFLLLTHIGTHPERTDKFWKRLGELIGVLQGRGYSFARLPAGPR